MLLFKSGEDSYLLTAKCHRTTAVMQEVRDPVWSNIDNAGHQSRAIVESVSGTGILRQEWHKDEPFTDLGMETITSLNPTDAKISSLGSINETSL